jgi:pimeloyl-ACP methyl ester carboxylesterase
VVIGHSLGGVIALALAERDPSNLRAVIDVDGNVSLGDCTYSSQIAAYPEAEAFATDGHAAVCDRLEAHADPIVRGYGARMRTASAAQLWRYSVDLVEAATARGPRARAGRRCGRGWCMSPGIPAARARARASCWRRLASTSARSGRRATGRSSSTPTRFAALVTELLS